ncbi:MAG: DUF4392 domain-containing protein [Gemmataceae bacterium]|nr:DUF4392 domain-containing protein [Gemmataceae bacterium]
MTADEKLAAILAAVQTDPGNRGLARDPHDNLFTATAGDFAAACLSIASHSRPWIEVVTGFYIPTADPPAYETDGPLGALLLANTLRAIGGAASVLTDRQCAEAICYGVSGLVDPPFRIQDHIPLPGDRWLAIIESEWPPSGRDPTHLIALERVGPGADGRCRTMRGVDVTDLTAPAHLGFSDRKTVPTIGVGDGGNEIGMGKVPHDTVVKNIPNGDLIHCRVPTDHLIVAGVSNWGAYALAAGLFVLRGVKPPSDLFDPDREREILEAMVWGGPLVDGVTGQQAATVDGLSWDEYAEPLVRIREILEA